MSVFKLNMILSMPIFKLFLWLFLYVLKNHTTFFTICFAPNSNWFCFRLIGVKWYFSHEQTGENSNPQHKQFFRLILLIRFILHWPRLTWPLVTYVFRTSLWFKPIEKEIYFTSNDGYITVSRKFKKSTMFCQGMYFII